VAICPFAVQQIIPESWSQGRIRPTTLIYHEAVSSADSLYGYWNTPGVELESHFFIGRFGVLYQYMDTEVRADANVDANGFAISVETWDDSNRDPLLGWNDAMVATAKRLAAWVCETHGVKRGPALTWNGGGIGGHNWFPQPWADGPRQCPGETRNRQLRTDIIPAVEAGYDWRTGGVDDLANSDEILAAIKDLQNDFTIRWFNSGKTDSSGRAIDRLGAMFPAIDNAGLLKIKGAVVPWTMTNAQISTYRAMFEQVLPKLDAIAKVLAAVAEDDDRVSLSPEQLATLKTSTGEEIAEQMAAAQKRMEEEFRAARAASEERFDELMEMLAHADTTADKAAFAAALREFFGRAVA
jgi:hypothetical protein